MFQFAFASGSLNGSGDQWSTSNSCFGLVPVEPVLGPSQPQNLTFRSQSNRRNARSGSLYAAQSNMPRLSPVSAMSTLSDGKGNISECSNDGNSILEDLRNACETPVDRLNMLISDMLVEFRSGLEVEGGSKDCKMIVTYIDELPSGLEKGIFYALDLGGTNFRVLRVHLGGKGKQLIDRQIAEVSIPREIMRGSHEELFDFIAGKLADFVEKEHNEIQFPAGQKRELGFTFSFPIHQTTIASGNLIKWTKGFKIAGTVGKDVVKALNEAMERKGLNMIVSALINDTVGTLAVASTASSSDEEVLISVILGTGTNACYVENIDAIPKWEGVKPRSGKMVINTEWGGLSSTHLPWTDYDAALDAASVNPGEQMFEKLLSGMYLGDVVRRVLLRFAEETSLFGPTVPSKLQIPFVLGTPNVSVMHHDNTPDLQDVGKVLENILGIENSSLCARRLVVEICGIVARRAGRLAGSGVVGLLRKIGRDVPRQGDKKKIVVSMDGGLYEHYPFFRQELQYAISELMGDEAAENVKIVLSKDGSGIGAALLAAAHSRYAKRN